MRYIRKEFQNCAEASRVIALDLSSTRTRSIVLDFTGNGGPQLLGWYPRKMEKKLDTNKLLTQFSLVEKPLVIGRKQ